MNTKLKPCPFCGCKDQNVVGHIDFDRAYHVRKISSFVKCPQCGKHTDYTNTPEEAVEMWNKKEAKQ